MIALSQHAMFAPVAAVFLSTALLLLLLRYPDVLVDRPNQRSLHHRPVPRTGGIAIVLGSLGASAAFLPDGRLLISLALAVSLVSLLDDWRGVAALPRFGAQLSVAAVFVRIGLGAPSIPESIFLVLTIVWVANLYNFMDGCDGLAGGMGLIGFSCYAFGAGMGGHIVLFAISSALAAATLPFLAFNFSPARIFMGDAGSVTLGFLAATLGALGWREGVWSPFFPVFVFSPFIADASLTLLKRILARERFWQSHRDHYYQKLMRMGLGHRNTALLEYLLMLVASFGALATPYLNGAQQLALIISWGAVLIALAFLVDRWWARYSGTAA